MAIASKNDSGSSNLKSKSEFRSDFTDELETFSCPKCLKVLETSVILPCLDVYCKNCLSLQILSTADRGFSGWYFTCFICKRKTYPPVKLKPKETWADLFPTMTFTTLTKTPKSDQKEPQEECYVRKKNHHLPSPDRSIKSENVDDVKDEERYTTNNENMHGKSSVSTRKKKPSAFVKQNEIATRINDETKVEEKNKRDNNNISMFKTTNRPLDDGKLLQNNFFSITDEKRRDDNGEKEARKGSGAKRKNKILKNIRKSHDKLTDITDEKDVHGDEDNSDKSSKNARAMKPFNNDEVKDDVVEDDKFKDGIGAFSYDSDKKGNIKRSSSGRGKKNITLDRKLRSTQILRLTGTKESTENRLDSSKTQLPPALVIVLRCPIHSWNIIDHFCKNHSVGCCIRCRLRHRQCSNLVSISFYAQIMSNEAESDSILKQLQCIANRVKKATETHELDIARLNAEIKKFPDEVNSFRGRLHDNLLEKLQSRIIELEDELYEKHLKSRKEAIKMCSSLEASVKISIKLLEIVRSCGRTTEQFVAEQRLRDKSKRYEEIHTSMMADIKRVTIKLKVHPAILAFITMEETEIGNFNINVDQNERKTIQDSKSKTVLTKEKSYIGNNKMNIKVNVKLLSKFKFDIPANQGQSHYTGATYLKDGSFILVDNQNKSCYIFDSMHTFAKEFRFQFPPRNACPITTENAELLVVTIPSKQEIAVLNLKDEIIPTSSFSTKFVCHAVVALSSEKIAVSGHNSSSNRYCWAVYSLTGKDKLYKEMEEDIKGGVTYLALNKLKTRIYISCSSKDSVVSCDILLSNDVIFTYKRTNLRLPHGVAVDKNDLLYIVGWASHNMHLVTPDGECVRVFVTDIPYNPQQICFNEKEDVLLVTNGRYVNEHVYLLNVMSEVHQPVAVI
ncbi:hypothetical protein CHS0354_002398 [Potamilus streckersoni]|uniref:RING-type domain-containing protein n=1 Tax=Potamilus streckersoni TaxID=2493646 RepID=A0AAE0RU79_9BIVA|nr:hypothetical protein CHS0354_002398 [Potamilus streckersoni]